MAGNGKMQYDRISNEATAFIGEQREALLKSGGVWTKGMTDLVSVCTAMAQTAAERNGQAFKTLCSCKTFGEFAELQSRIGQQNFDDFMSGATKISELCAKLTTEAIEPINTQFGHTARKATKSMAA